MACERASSPPSQELDYSLKEIAESSFLAATKIWDFHLMQPNNSARV